jgi:hypothetical protein
VGTIGFSGHPCGVCKTYGVEARGGHASEALWAGSVCLSSILGKVSFPSSFPARIELTALTEIHTRQRLPSHIYNREPAAVDSSRDSWKIEKGVLEASSTTLFFLMRTCTIAVQTIGKTFTSNPARFNPLFLISSVYRIGRHDMFQQSVPSKLFYVNELESI